MPVPSLITDLTTDATTNSPAGSESPSTTDDYLRAHASFIAQMRNSKINNPIINGSFVVNQRAVTGTVTLAAGAYGHDRWKAGASGCTYTFAGAAGLVTITITAGSLQQVIEGINLQSGTHTLSWEGTALGKIGAGTSSSSGVTGMATGGTNLTVEFSSGTLSLVRLSVGSAATPFEYRPYSVELVMCQRYYQYVKAGFVGYSNAGANFGGGVNYKTVMRAAPTINLVIGNIDFAAVNVGLASSYIGVDVGGMVIFRVVTITGPAQFSEAVSLSAEL